MEVVVVVATVADTLPHPLITVDTNLPASMVSLQTAMEAEADMALHGLAAMATNATEDFTRTATTDTSVPLPLPSRSCFHSWFHCFWCSFSF